jgi:hypothetical protein
MATVEFVPSLARTTSGTGPAVDGLAVQSTLRIQLDVTAASGTGPTLDVVIEDTIDGTNWNTIAVMSQKTAPSREVVDVTSPFTGTVRARWTISGTTPSFTFSVLAHAE